MLQLGLLCRVLALLVAAAALAGGVSRTSAHRVATGKIATSVWPYLPGSSIRLRVTGFTPPYHAALLGPGSLSPDGIYEIPQRTRGGTALLIAGNIYGLAATNLHIVAAPNSGRPLLLVASYDDGIVFHDADNFSVIGILATGGAPSDAAVDPDGKIAATDTQGSSVTLATLCPWSVLHINGIALGDEIGIDAGSHDIFVTNRDVNGSGALTRITTVGKVSRVTTGATAEGVAIDSRHHIVYVANTNDGTVAAVDARTMRLIRRFKAVARVFSLALSGDGGRLYAVSNQNAGSPFAAAGAVVALDLRPIMPRIVARSADLTFPLGIALDPTTKTLFVTDEARSEVDVLDARTLDAKHLPLRTCATPWKPAFDSQRGRLYVPCAGANAVDVFDTRTFRRATRAPFSTGGYPLAVAIWRSPNR